MLSQKRASAANIWIVWRFAPSTVSTRVRTCWLFTPMNASIAEYVNRNAQSRQSFQIASRRLNAGWNLTENMPSLGPILRAKRPIPLTPMNGRMCRTNTISFSALIRAGPKLGPTARPERHDVSNYLLCEASALDLLAFDQPFR